MLGAVSLRRPLRKLSVDLTVTCGSRHLTSGKRFLCLTFEPSEGEEYMVYGEKCKSCLVEDRGKWGRPY